MRPGSHQQGLEARRHGHLRKRCASAREKPGGDPTRATLLSPSEAQQRRPSSKKQASSQPGGTIVPTVRLVPGIQPTSHNTRAPRVFCDGVPGGLLTLDRDTKRPESGRPPLCPQRLCEPAWKGGSGQKHRDARMAPPVSSSPTPTCIPSFSLLRLQLGRGPSSRLEKDKASGKIAVLGKSDSKSQIDMGGKGSPPVISFQNNSGQSYSLPASQGSALQSKSHPQHRAPLQPPSGHGAFLQEPGAPRASQPGATRQEAGRPAPTLPRL